MDVKKGGLGLPFLFDRRALDQGRAGAPDPAEEIDQQQARHATGQYARRVPGRDEGEGRERAMQAKDDIGDRAAGHTAREPDQLGLFRIHTGKTVAGEQQHRGRDGQDSDDAGQGGGPVETHQRLRVHRQRLHEAKGQETARHPRRQQKRNQAPATAARHATRCHAGADRQHEGVADLDPENRRLNRRRQIRPYAEPGQNHQKAAKSPGYGHFGEAPQQILRRPDSRAARRRCEGLVDGHAPFPTEPCGFCAKPIASPPAKEAALHGRNGGLSIDRSARLKNLHSRRRAPRAVAHHLSSQRPAQPPIRPSARTPRLYQSARKVKVCSGQCRP
ncbi:hypothetical protein CC_3251 [Caulobacter vibrioides CB15]|uniref:Uncharacterized protein n=1 Tax=Caulobacter vibrioides (strain ATCC 19089 / CIP 103742 / CB 15) TaxID=190650 RepID=Q9A3F3_CAUVC|nr:hypothetical protein CC_3251 [Caulobacter vibrioides CB15]